MKDGIYKATITDHGIAVSKEKHTPEVFIQFDIDGEIVFGDFWLTDSAVKRTIEQLKVAGFTGKTFSELNAEPPILAGAEVSVTVRNEEYNGTVTPRVAFINDPNFRGGRRKADIEANVSRFDALLAIGSGEDVPF